MSKEKHLLVGNGLNIQFSGGQDSPYTNQNILKKAATVYKDDSFYYIVETIDDIFKNSNKYNDGRIAGLKETYKYNKFDYYYSSQIIKDLEMLHSNKLLEGNIDCIEINRCGYIQSIKNNKKSFLEKTNKIIVNRDRKKCRDIINKCSKIKNYISPFEIGMEDYLLFLEIYYKYEGFNVTEELNKYRNVLLFCIYKLENETVEFPLSLLNYFNSFSLIFTVNYDTHLEKAMSHDIIKLHRNVYPIMEGLSKDKVKQIKEGNSEFNPTILEPDFLKFIKSKKEINLLESFKSITGELHIIGLSPKNDTHIFELLESNKNITKIIYYYFDELEYSVIKQSLPNKFKDGNLIGSNVNLLWKKYKDKV